MQEDVEVSGIILSAMPMGEYDKRVVLLTREFGKISAFARGARRPKSALLAAANPFVFGSFHVMPGRNSWTLLRASVREYFSELPMLLPGVYYGFYFLEFADWYSREGLDATETLNLLYITLKTLVRQQPEERLVRCIYELRLMTINGEFNPEVVQGSEALKQCCRYIAAAPLQKLFHFTLKPEVLAELEQLCRRQRERILDRRIKSLEILEQMI